MFWTTLKEAYVLNHTACKSKLNPDTVPWSGREKGQTGLLPPLTLQLTYHCSIGDERCQSFRVTSIHQRSVCGLSAAEAPPPFLHLSPLAAVVEVGGGGGGGGTHKGKSRPLPHMHKPILRASPLLQRERAEEGGGGGGGGLIHPPCPPQTVSSTFAVATYHEQFTSSNVMKLVVFTDGHQEDSGSAELRPSSAQNCPYLQNCDATPLPLLADVSCTRTRRLSSNLHNPTKCTCNHFTDHR